jgi:hypothetical protein
MAVVDSVSQAGTWGNDSFRKVVLNAFLWLAHAEIPANGVESTVTADELEANLDLKKK